MTNMQINENTHKKPMSEAAKKFFASPSKLGKGRRFKGSINTNTYAQQCTNQSDGFGA